MDTLEPLDVHYFQYGTPALLVTKDVCDKANSLAKNLLELQAASSYRESRLAKGFEAYVRGLHEACNEYRVYEFVRGIDGILGASNCNKFRHRLRALLPNTCVSDNELKQMYQIRSEVAHLNAWGTALSGYPTGQKPDELANRCLQAEVLAAALYRHVLSSEQRRDALLDDRKVKEFWRKGSEQKRSQIWGDVQLTGEDKQRLSWSPRKAVTNPPQPACQSPEGDWE